VSSDHYVPTSVEGLSTPREEDLVIDLASGCRISLDLADLPEPMELRLQVADSSLQVDRYWNVYQLEQLGRPQMVAGGAVPPGTYQVRVWVDAELVLESGAQEITGDTTIRVPSPRSPGGDVHVTVLSRDGSSLHGAVLKAGGQVAISDAEGHCLLRRSRTRDRLRVEMPGFASQSLDWPRDSDELVVTLEAVPAARWRLRFPDPSGGGGRAYSAVLAPRGAPHLPPPGMLVDPAAPRQTFRGETTADGTTQWRPVDAGDWYLRVESAGGIACEATVTFPPGESITVPIPTASNDLFPAPFPRPSRGAILERAPDGSTRLVSRFDNGEGFGSGFLPRRGATYWAVYSDSTGDRIAMVNQDQQASRNPSAGAGSSCNLRVVGLDSSSAPLTISSVAVFGLESKRTISPTSRGVYVLSGVPPGWWFCRAETARFWIQITPGSELAVDLTRHERQMVELGNGLQLTAFSVIDPSDPRIVHDGSPGQAASGQFQTNAPAGETLVSISGPRWRTYWINSGTPDSKRLADRVAGLRLVNYAFARNGRPFSGRLTVVPVDHRGEPLSNFGGVAPFLFRGDLSSGEVVTLMVHADDSLRVFADYGDTYLTGELPTVAGDSDATVDLR